MSVSLTLCIGWGILSALIIRKQPDSLVLTFGGALIITGVCTALGVA